MIKPYFETDFGKLYCGNVFDILPQLGQDSVQTCVTSPPYWNLRRYMDDNHPDKADEIGTEDTPEEYVSKMVRLYSLIKPLLKKDSCCWLNLGDSYIGGGRGSGYSEKQDSNKGTVDMPASRIPPGYKPKDLAGIPHKTAFALQAAGWWFRQDIVYAKNNPMPESVTDRVVKAHEYLFLLSKSGNYYFDYKAIREPASFDGRKDTLMKGSGKYASGDYLPNNNPNSLSLAGNAHERWILDENGERVRNKRSVWSVNTKPNPVAHFATFPEALILPCVLAGSKEGDIVLDPFMGSGTTALLCEKLGRKWIGIDLNSEYCDIAAKQLRNLNKSITYTGGTEAKPTQGSLFQ